MHYVLHCILIFIVFFIYVYIVADNEPTTSSQTGANQSGEDKSDGDSSRAPAIATGTIAAIAIIALIVIGVILGACYLRYNFYCKIFVDNLPYMPGIIVTGFAIEPLTHIRFTHCNFGYVKAMNLKFANYNIICSSSIT